MTHCCYKPCNLVLKPNECFYCACTDGIITYEVEHRNKGILTCEKHACFGIRDTKAYLHEENIVLIRDINKYSEMKEFRTILEDNIQVIRSNGNIDDNWKIASIINDNQAIIVKIDNNWTITLVKDDIQKDIYISDFLNIKLKYYQIENFSNILNNLIALLDNGIYKEYFNQQNGMTPQKYIDNSCFTIPVIVNGMIARVVVNN
jgi:hypothetical protein